MHRHLGRAGRGIAFALTAAIWAAGCGQDREGSARRLSPRGVPYLEGVAVPAGFTLTEKMVDAYNSGGIRFARHEYRGAADAYAVRDFYLEQMPLMGWTRVSDQNVKGRITIRLEMKNEECTVDIESKGLFRHTTVQVIVKPFSRTPHEPPKRPVP